MKASIALLALVILQLHVNSATAQYPDQFYTNGKEIDVWRVEADRKTILWFSREPGDRITYKQSLVIVYNSDPEWAYYVNLGTRKFIGRYSFTREGYSLLHPDSRREKINDIREDAFPAPREMPTVAQLLPTSRNLDRLSKPPATKEYPDLRNSSWDSTYFTVGRDRVRARLTLKSDRGTYEFRSDGISFKGTLENVRYGQTEQKLFLITGTWRLEGRGGYFRFVVSPENLNLFQGEWGFDDGIEGTWNGTRIRPE